ncbi:MAG: hypothetical protein ACXQTP_03825 [Candidatus Methanofastidiosia archaeon]
MKKSMKSIFFSISIIATILLMPVQTGADVVGNEIFLQGNYIELGIHEAGSFGAANEAPAGFHPVCPDYPGQIGFVTNNLDYFLPGSPFEGWTLEWTYDSVEYMFENYGLDNEWWDVPMTSHTETSAGDVLSAVWVGEASYDGQSIQVTQTVTLNRTDRFFTVEITLENTGDSLLSSVEYLRTVDPDNEHVATGVFETHNYVTSSPDMVFGKGLKYGATLYLQPVTANAALSVNYYWDTDPDVTLDSPYTPSEGDNYIEDAAIALAYRFDSLDVGASVTFSFIYGIPYAYIPPENPISPAIFKPLLMCHLTEASALWDCIAANMPEEITADVQEMIDEVQAHMTNATSLSNPIYSSGELVKAINLMKNLIDTLELPCNYE